MAGTSDGSASTAQTSFIDDDRVRRQIIYNLAFEGEAVAANKLLSFMGNSNPDNSFDESLDLERLSPENETHTRGCDAVFTKNLRQEIKRRAQGLLPVEPVGGVDRKYYCGFTVAPISSLTISGDRYVTEVRLEPENGNDAHVSIILRPKPGATKISPPDRTEAAARLGSAFANPKSHICECDLADPEHPVTKHGAGILELKRASA